MARLARYLTATCLVLIGAIPLARSAPESVSIRFRVLGIGARCENLHYFDGSEFHGLRFPRTGRSDRWYAYNGPPVIDLFIPDPEAGPVVDAHGRRYRRVARTPAPNTLSDGLLIVSSALRNRHTPPARAHYVPLLIDDSPTAFPPDSILFANLTGGSLHGGIADRALPLPEGRSLVMRYAESLGTTGGRIRIRFAARTAEGPKWALDNELSVCKNRRVLLILRPPKRAESARIEAHALVDAAHPPALK